MLDTNLPIELTHKGLLMSGDGRKWSAGIYPANSVPKELAQEHYGKNLEATEDRKYTEVPTLGDKAPTPTPASTPAPTPAPTPEVKVEDKLPGAAKNI